MEYGKRGWQTKLECGTVRQSIDGLEIDEQASIARNQTLRRNERKTAQLSHSTCCQMGPKLTPSSAGFAGLRKNSRQ
jgi:hypothetical protein